jgi:hypothetical protein
VLGSGLGSTSGGDGDEGEAGLPLLTTSLQGWPYHTGASPCLLHQVLLGGFPSQAQPFFRGRRFPTGGEQDRVSQLWLVWPVRAEGMWWCDCRCVVWRDGGTSLDKWLNLSEPPGGQRGYIFLRIFVKGNDSIICIRTLALRRVQ